MAAITVTSRGPVAWLTLNQPERRNPLDTQTCLDLAAALAELGRNATTRVVVITGAGKVFSAGADIREFRETGTFEDRAEYGARIDLCRALARLGKPSIAAVNGHALGAGAGLVSWCDLAVASDRARFGYPEIDRGISVGVTAVALLRLVGRKRATQLALLGESISAAEAERFGLINWVVPADQLEPRVNEVAGALAAKSPIALRLCREVLWTVEDVEYWKALEVARDLRVLSRTSADAREGTLAFLEKRPPVWHGR